MITSCPLIGAGSQHYPEQTLEAPIHTLPRKSLYIEIPLSSENHGM